jgi:hypothetical protein
LLPGFSSFLCVDLPLELGLEPLPLPFPLDELGLEPLPFPLDELGLEPFPLEELGLGFE